MLPEQLREHPTARDLEARFPSAIVEAKLDRGELTLVIEPVQLVEVCQFLKQDQRFTRLSSITGVDWFPSDPRFEVVYHLHSLDRNARLGLKCRVKESDCELDSVTGVWRSANWYEREVFDMFGVLFRNHPNLQRILMPVNWQGHPLRKDYAVHGYKYSYGKE